MQGQDKEPEKTHLKADPAQPDDADESAVKERQRTLLTQIESSFNQNSDSQGFVDATKNANQALKDNKIVLNHRFVLEHTLGAGGMGTVYKAQDLRKIEAEDSNPYAAVKILNSDFRKHPSAFKSLQREASRSHMLSHPNIVTVHDFDRDGNILYMTMELLKGEDLETLLNRFRSHGMPQDKALSILKDFCTGLMYAHGKGIIHSDLKPGNLFVAREGAKILDFGIARIAAESRHQDDFDAGSIGAITPAYASLEMLAKQPPDQRDDVFAAAIIAYEMLSGHHPFQQKSASTALATGLKPERIESLSKRQWDALEKALKLKREERTETIEEFMLGMTTKPQFPLFKWASALLTIALIGFAGFRYYAPDEVSTAINAALEKAESCFKQKDYQCTVSNAQAVLKLDTDNNEARSLLTKANDAVTESNIQLLLTQARACLDNNDFDCADARTSSALQLSPDHRLATKLYQRVQKKKNAWHAAQSVKLQMLDDALAKAESCLKQSNYGCVFKETDKALKIDPGNAIALKMQQQADIEQQQQKSARLKAEKILQDGKKCFKQLNYSCAIAKSESALEFVPGYRPALKLQQDAQAAMRNAKKAIQIN